MNKRAMNFCSEPLPENAAGASATAIGHAGEFLQGIIHEDGEHHAVLVSIPTPELGSRAQFKPDAANDLNIQPHWKQKSRRAFELTWQSFCNAPPSGCLQLESDLPVSRGMGSSTADCVASIRAAALYFGQSLSSQQIARLAHKAEQSSDATMYGSRLVVFRHREGRAHRTLPALPPPFDLVIAESASGARLVDTDTLLRPDYTRREIAEFGELLSRFCLAAERFDPAEMASVSERSAEINQRYHPMPGLLETRAVARSFGAYGTAISHSGDIQVMLFAPGMLSRDLIRELNRELLGIGIGIWRTLTDRQRMFGSAHTPLAEGEVANHPSGAEET